MTMTQLETERSVELTNHMYETCRLAIADDVSLSELLAMVEEH